MLQTKAIYNLLRLQVAEDSSIKAEPWAIEDLRTVALETLFQRLESYQIKLNKESFIEFGDSSETPEELTGLLISDEMEEEERDPAYLLIFELWRRLLSDKPSLSIFFDELDHRIALYDQGLLTSDEPIQEILTNLLEVLEDNEGVKPEEIFVTISQYCAHDISDFLCDFICNLLENGDSLHASELIEGFAPYAEDPHWFDFFRMRLLALTDVGDAHAASSRLLECELSLSLLLEMLRFFSHADRECFVIAFKKAAPLATDPEDAAELLSMAADAHSPELQTLVSIR